MMLKLYQNIKKYRKLNGWTQQELAMRTGYGDRSSISKIESGVVDLPRSAIIRFADAFGITPGELMGSDGVVPKEASLSPQESEILSLFRQLDDTDRAVVKGFFQGLLEAEKYKEKVTTRKTV